MGKITKSEVKKTAKLADLDLTDSELDKYTFQLSEVVSYFDGLNELRTDNINPTSQTTGLQDVTRPDSIDTTRILAKADALSGTEEVHNDYFIVPQVIDKESD